MKHCIHTACRAVSAHLYLPPSNFWNHHTISKKQVGSSHKAPTSFVKGKGWIKRKENACPIVEGEVSRDLPVYTWDTKPQFHHWSGGLGDTHLWFPTQEPLQRSTKGVSLPPRLWRDMCNQRFLEAEVIFTSERGGVPLYRKLPAKTAAGMAQPPESLMGISSKPLGIFSSTLQPVADIR